MTTTCLPGTIRRRHWDLGQIYAFQQVLIVQPSQRSQFLVGVDYDLAGPARTVHGRQHRPVADMLLQRRLLLLRMVMLLVIMMGGMMIGAAAVEMIGNTGAAAAAARGDDHVVVDEVVLRTAHVHLFRGEQDNVAHAVHAFRCGYIILAEMSLLQYDQFGCGRGRRRRRRRRGGWRHDRRRRR